MNMTYIGGKYKERSRLHQFIIYVQVLGAYTSATAHIARHLPDKGILLCLCSGKAFASLGETVTPGGNMKS